MSADHYQSATELEKKTCADPVLHLSAKSCKIPSSSFCVIQTETEPCFGGTSHVSTLLNSTVRSIRGNVHKKHQYGYFKLFFHAGI